MEPTKLHASQWPKARLFSIHTPITLEKLEACAGVLMDDVIVAVLDFVMDVGMAPCTSDPLPTSTALISSPTDVSECNCRRTDCYYLAV